jgi:hypothetical protein
MKKPIILIALLLAAFSFETKAQKSFVDTMLYTVERGDTIYDFHLDPLLITAAHHFGNDTLRYRFNQLKYNIKVVFPYVKEAGRLVNEVNNTIPTLSRRERKKYLKQKEEELRTKFEEPLKNLYDTQGRLLILLINRETGNSVYHTLKEIKNPVKAAMYQASAVVNGINLKEEWDADKYKNEDLIMRNFEKMYGYQTTK